MSRFMPGPVPLGNVVRDFRIGNTRVIVCDDAYRDRSEEEQRQSLLNVSRIASEALRDRPANEEAELIPVSGGFEPPA